MGAKLTAKEQRKIGKGVPPIKHQFKPGQSGNPKGRPKLPDLKECLADVLGDEKEQVTALKAILMSLRKKALSGDVRAAQILLDRAYGSAVQKVAQTDTNGVQLPSVILNGAKRTKKTDN